MKIIKRGNTLVDFNLNKIIRTVLKSMGSTNINNQNIAKKIAIQIRENVKELDKTDVIHDMVVEKLISYGYIKASESYNLYRIKKGENLYKNI